MVSLIRERSGKKPFFLDQYGSLSACNHGHATVPYKSTAEPVELPLKLSGGVACALDPWEKKESETMLRSHCGGYLEDNHHAVTICPVRLSECQCCDRRSDFCSWVARIFDFPRFLTVTFRRLLFLLP